MLTYKVNAFEIIVKGIGALHCQTDVYSVENSKPASWIPEDIVYPALHVWLLIEMTLLAKFHQAHVHGTK